MSTGPIPVPPTPAPATPKRYYTSVFPGKSQPVPDDLASAILDLEAKLQKPLWLMLQTDTENGLFEDISNDVREGFLGEKSSLVPGEKIALLIHSWGGAARCAYQIAKFFRSQCGGFDAVIPKCAKSAATLLSLGAQNIRLGQHGELGPLDAQLHDPEREDYMSALDEVQTLERLHSFSIRAVDSTVLMLRYRTGKKMETLLPQVLSFVSQMMVPLFEAIDTTHYTQMSRVLKVAEEYAVRLLQPQYSRDRAQNIARHLVENYPEHGFCIDHEEATSIGLKTIPFTGEEEAIATRLYPWLGKITLVGRLLEVVP
ncbi:MAG TPA: hypothetical protein VJM82_03210 [Nitrospiraceae bacterium]|nr:hypothetical protein [Nitrospiraceae bacterium]